MQMIGYFGYDDKMVPIAAADTWEECLPLCLERMMLVTGGDFLAMFHGELAIEPKDITPEEGKDLDALIAEHLG